MLIERYIVITERLRDAHRRGVDELHSLWSSMTKVERSEARARLGEQGWEVKRVAA